LQEGVSYEEALSLLIRIEGGEFTAPEELIPFLKDDDVFRDRVSTLGSENTKLNIRDYLNIEAVNEQVVKTYTGGGSDLSLIQDAINFYTESGLELPPELKTQSQALESKTHDLAFFDVLVLNLYSMARSSYPIILGEWGAHFNPVPIDAFIRLVDIAPWASYFNKLSVVEVLFNLDRQLDQPISKEIKRSMDKNK
jgi:hypothetical protein